MSIPKDELSDYQQGYKDGYDYAMKKSKEILHNVVEEIKQENDSISK